MMNLNQNEILSLNKQYQNSNLRRKKRNMSSSISLKSGINKIFIVFY
jgi:hypothetical protein